MHEILVAGERGFIQRERSLGEGVTVYEAVWRNTAGLTEGLGVTIPA